MKSSRHSLTILRIVRNRIYVRRIDQAINEACADFPQSAGTDKNMEPYAEHTKIERWDENGKPYLAEYEGSAKMQNKKVLITGGDSGIGKTVASKYLSIEEEGHPAYILLLVFSAREGADVSIVYLPEEQVE